MNLINSSKEIIAKLVKRITHKKDWLYCKRKVISIYRNYIKSFLQMSKIVFKCLQIVLGIYISKIEIAFLFKIFQKI